MSKLPLILDIGYRDVKALQFKSNFAGNSFENAKRYEFKAQEASAKSDELVAFLKENYVECHGIYLNLPGEKIFTREFRFPFIDKKKVRDIIPFELENQISFDLTDVVYDYYSYVNLADNATQVLVQGIEKKYLIPVLDIFRDNNLKVSGLYAANDAIYQLFRFVNEPNAILLYISSVTCTILEIQDSQWVSSRTIPMGYDIISHMLAQKWKKNIAYSENMIEVIPVSKDKIDYAYLKKEYRISKSEVEVFQETCKEFGSRLAHEVTISSSVALKADNTFVYLMSDMKNHSMFESMMRATNELEIKSFPFDKTPLATINREFAVNVGGVFSATSGKGLNFLKGDFKKHIISGERTINWPALILAATAIGFLVFSFSLGYLKNKQYLSNLKSQNVVLFKKYFSRLSASNKKLKTQAQEIVSKKKDETKIYQTFFKSPAFSSVLTVFNRALRADLAIEIESLDYNGRALNVRGSVASFTELDELKKDLETSKCYKEIIQKNVRTTLGKGGKKRVKFLLQINIIEEESEEQRQCS